MKRKMCAIPKSSWLPTILIMLCALLWGITANADVGGSCGENLAWSLNDDGVLTISGDGEMTSHPWNTEDVQSVVFEGNALSIGDQAFKNCSNLMSITIPDGVISIGESAFSGCSSLTSIMIPDGVSSVGASAFDNCNAARYANIGSDGAKALGKAGYSFREDAFDLIYRYENDLLTGLEIIGANKDIESITIPVSVTSIGNSAFSGCSSLASITIPNGVTSIGNAAFNGCSSLTSITIPDSVTSIKGFAFWNCSSLTSITIPDLTSIEDDTFCNCSSLTSITIPDSVTSIGANAFSGCRSLTGITIPEGITSIGDSAFIYCSALEGITIPDGVTGIEDYTFYSCNSLKNISIPDSVTNIGNYAFSGCGSLKGITIPDGVTGIGNSAFSRCYNLKNVTIPDGVTSIGNSAFSGCWNLGYITIPNSVTSIGDYAFNDCNYWFDAYLPNSECTFGDSIFSNNIKIYCYSGTDADRWAVANGYEIVYLDQVNVSDIRIFTVESDFDLPLGMSQKLSYKVFPAPDHPTVVWSSSNPSILTIDAQGYVTALSLGTATVTGICDQRERSVQIRVYKALESFGLSADEVWITENETYQLQIVDPYPADGEQRFEWYSSDRGIATVSDGLVTSISPGDVTITASTERGIRKSCLIHSCYPVSAVDLISPREMMLIEETIQITANVTMSSQSCVNHLVTFSSSDESVATVDPESGLVYATGHGEVTITAVSANNCSDTVDLMVHVLAEDSAVDPTCTEPGLTEGSHCEVCGEILVPQEVIAPLGHAWGEPVYTWSSDETHVTGTCVCGRDAAHMLEETVFVNRILQRVPTETDRGLYRLECGAFTNPIFTAPAYFKMGIIPALGTLDTLTLPALLTEIDDEAFEGISAQAVILPEGCASIGSRAFADCGSLLYVQIPAGVEVAPDAFSGSDLVVIDQR